MAGTGPLTRSASGALADGLFGAVVLSLCAYLLARSCLLASVLMGGAALWPVNGLILAACLRRPGPDRSITLALGCLADFAARAVSAQGLQAAGVYSLCDGLEILVALELLRSLIGETIDLTRVRDLLLLLTIVGCAAPMTSAAAQTALLRAPIDAAFGAGLLKTAAAHALGVLILAPPVMTLTGQSLKALDRAVRSGRGAASVGLFVGVTVLIFSQRALPLFFLAPPTLIFVAFELGQAGVALALLASAAAALAMSAMGQGPIAMILAPPDVRLRVLQIYLAVMGLAVIPVAAALARRDQLEEALRAALAAAQAGESRASEALRQSRLAQQIAGVGAWRYDPSTHLSLWSDETYAIHGIDRSPSGEALADADRHYRLEDRELLAAFVERTLVTGEPFEVRVRFHRPGALEERTAVIRGEADLDPEGAVRAVIGVIRDVTREETARRRIQESELRYRAIAENASDVIIRTGVDGCILYVSPSVTSITGHRGCDLVGRPLLELLHPDDLPLWRGFYGALVHGAPEPCAKTFRIRRPDGADVWLESNPTVLCDAEGAPSEVIDVLRDVSARMALEEELRAARDAAEAAAAVKSDFMANMSHEIRTPLTAILGYTRLIEDRGDLSEAALSALRRVASAGQALLAIVNDILDFSKLEAGRVTIDPAPMSPADLIHDVVAMFEPEASRKAIDLGFEAASETPAWVEADAYRLRQIAMNLIGNAVKFTDEGHVRVRCAYDADLQRLTLTVSDTGPGLSPDQQAGLFKRFSQVDGSITRRHGGTGLGLAICKGLAEMMDGGVRVDSRPGEGATFSVWIKAPLSETPAGASAGRPEATGLADARVLVVDDNPVNRELVRAILSPIGVEMSEARDGREALDLARTAAFDVVLMDLQMPEMDGFAAAAALQAMDGPNRTVPILAFSADSEIEDRRKLANFAGFVRKPIAPSDLLAALSAALILPERPSQRAPARQRA